MNLKHISKGQRDNQKDRAEVDRDTSQNSRSKDIEQKQHESRVHLDDAENQQSHTLARVA